MLKRLPNLLTFAILFLVGSGVNQEEPKLLARISGRVEPFPGYKLPDVVTVKLQESTGVIVASQSLIQKRSFLFEYLRRGQYTITAEGTGFQAVSKTVVFSPFGSLDEHFVRLTLGQSLDEEESASRMDDLHTISVAQLAIPDSALQELTKADLESSRNKPEKAIGHLIKALEIYPDLYQAHNNLAVQYLRLGRISDAVKALENSIELNSDDARTHRNLAEVHLSQAAWLDALRALDRAIGIEPESGKSMRLAGEAYLGLGDIENALNFFQKALAHGPQNHSFLGLGKCYLELGEKAAALDEFKGFLNSYPDDPRADAVRKLAAQLSEELKP